MSETYVYIELAILTCRLKGNYILEKKSTIDANAFHFFLFHLLQFITDRPSSRVLAHPGGGSSITLG